MKAIYSIKPLVILGILASHQGYVRSESNCDDNAKLQYETGKSYVYNLEQISYDGTKENWESFEHMSGRVPKWSPRTRGKITTGGKVVLTALSSCQFAITLQDVATQIAGERVGDAGDSRNGTVPRTSMLFTFRNGEVSNLFKQEGETPIWSENILRGILTMIQNKGMGNSDGEPEEKETNIKGECISRVFIPHDGSYKKTILSGQCSEPVITPSEGVSYESAGHVVERPHFRHSSSFIRCHNNVSDGLLSSVGCVEMNELPNIRMLSIRAETISTLKLEQAAAETEEVGGVTADEISSLTEATSITYDPSRTHADKTWEKGALVEALNLAKAMYLDSELNRAQLYLKLKEILISVKDFQKLEEAIEADSQDDSMKFQFILNMVRNIATEIGTEGAVIYISSLIHNKALTPGPVAVFHTHLYLTKDPTLEGLKALDLIVGDTLDEYNNGGIFDTINVFSEKKRIIRQQLLGVSAYAYQFCRKNPSCGDLPEYQNLIDKIAQFATSKTPDLTHAALQAIGNVPSLPESTVKIIKDILDYGGSILYGGQTKFLSSFEAFRRDPCQPTLKQITREILENNDNSLEVRATAYMAVVRCLDEEDVKAINGILENTPMSALSSFIASHFHNIMDSQSPSKFAFKTGLLSQISVPESVLTVHNATHTTKFLEYSTFHPDKNLGFSAEAALIFDGGSIPQFIHVNWTVDAFGKSYNTFQAGLSSRLSPPISHSKVASVMNFFDVKYNTAIMELVPILFAMDSYFRVFGTTITMGVDAAETLKSQQFFDHRKDPESQVLKFDFVKAFTLLDHEIKVPTISGLPLSVAAQMAYLPIVSASHTGDTNGIGFKDLLTKWDEKTGTFAHNSSSDSAFVAGFDYSIGKGTPVHMGYNAMAKIRVNHSIGFESVMEESGWLKTIHFPDMTVASVRLTGIRQFFMKQNGHEFQTWNMFGDKNPMAPREIFQLGGWMGLQASGLLLSQRSSEMDAPFDAVIKVEKTEEQFTGYGLAIELKDEGETTKKFGVKAMAYGLSTEDTLRLSFNYTDVGVHDLEGFNEKPHLGATMYMDMSQRNMKPTGLLLKFKSTGQLKSVLAEYPNFSEFTSAGILSTPTGGLVVRPEYALEVDTIEEGEKVRVFDWTIHNNKEDANMTMTFSGPLEKSLGEVQMKVSNKELGSQDSNAIRSRAPTHRHPTDGLEVKAEFSHKSEDCGESRLVMDFTAQNGEIWVNRTLQFQSNTYEITEHIVFPKSHEVFEEDGTTPESSQTNAGYKLSYKDSNNGISASAAAEYNKLISYLENSQETHLQNLSLHVVSGGEDDALFIEATHLMEWDRSYETVINGLKRKTINVYVDAFGKKQAEFTSDLKYTETGIDGWGDCMAGTFVYPGKDGKLHRCRTHNKVVGLVVPDQFEFVSTFNNDERHSLKKVIKAYHTGSEMKFHLTYDLDYPLARNERGLESKLAISLENLQIEENKQDWSLESNLDLDMENKTLELTSMLKRDLKQGSPADAWSTWVNGKWENDEIWNGECKFSIRQQCPSHFVTTVDIENKGSQKRERDSSLFTNSLAVTIDTQGKTKDLKPKRKYTWTIVSDTRLTEEEKTMYDFAWKWHSDLKRENMLEQPVEIFSWKKSVNFFKIINQEIWKLKDGQFSLIQHGQEKAAGNWEIALYIIPERHSQEGSESTAVSHHAPGSSQSTQIKLTCNMDGWFEQEVNNNTVSFRYVYYLLPHDIRLMSSSDFSLKKTDMNDGRDLFSLDVRGTRDDYYKDILHFSHFEKFNLNIDNKTWAFVKKIRLNGPHLSVHIQNDGETDEDSWLVDFDGGLFEEKHQHKLNFQGKSGYKADHKHNHHHHHHPHHHAGFIPYTNFNMTVSRRR